MTGNYHESLSDAKVAIELQPYPLSRRLHEVRFGIKFTTVGHVLLSILKSERFH